MTRKPSKPKAGPTVEVKVEASKNQPNAKRRRPRRRGGKNPSRIDKLEREFRRFKLSTTGTPGKDHVRVPVSAIAADLSDKQTTCLDTLSAKWVGAYVDPCGEHDPTPGQIMIPDGAPQQVSPVRFAAAQTITPPIPLGIADLYSMLFLHLPTTRFGVIVVLRRKGGEFSHEIIEACMKAMRAIKRVEDMTYPNWLETEMMVDGEVDVFVTNFAPSVMAQVQHPNENGTGGDLVGFREAARGLNVYFNAPDLANQGTVAAGQWKLDVSYHTLVHPSGRIPISIGMVLVGGGQARISITASAVLNEAGILWLAGSTSNTWVATADVVEADGAVVLTTGDSWKYEVIGGSVGVFVLRIRNITADSSTILWERSATQLPGTTATKHSFLFTSTGDTTKDVELKYKKFKTPALTQADIVQNDPNNYIGLMRCKQGAYQPLRAWQPVYSFQDGGNLLPWTFATDGHDPSDPWLTGFADSHDVQFNIGVINLQGLSGAATPYVKLTVFREILPTPTNLLVATIMKAGLDNPNARQMAHAMANALGHGFPADYNGLGTLFSFVKKVFSRIPAYMATVQKINAVVSECAGHVMDGVEMAKE